MAKRQKALKRQLRAANDKIEKLESSSMDSATGQLSPSGGWANPDNNFGPETDPTFDTIYLPPYEFTFRELTNMYQNPLMKRVITLHAGDGTRKGFELGSQDNIDQARDIKSEMDERFNWVAQGAKMIAIRHLYGGGVLFADVDDGRLPEEPINENRVKKVWSFRPVENWYAYPITMREMFGEEKPGQPLHYNITVQAFGGAETFKCHESRLIRFPAYESDDVLSQNERVRRRSWPFSTTQIIYDGIKRYGIGVQSGSQLLQSFVEDVFKVSKLKAYKDPAELREYIRSQRAMRNSLRATVIGEDDDLTKLAQPTTGLKEITADQRRDIGMITGIPVPLLFSEESGSLGGSTLSESREVWFDDVESNQKNKYEPMYRRMMEIVSYETGWDIGDVFFLWNPLQRTTPLDQAKLEREVAEKDQIYVEIFGANPVDILDRRWGGGEFSSATPDFDRVDFEAELKKAADEEAELARKEMESLQSRDNPEPVKVELEK